MFWFRKKEIWQITNRHKVLSRLERLQEPGLLAKIVRFSADRVVRVTALNKIYDQKILADLANLLGRSDDGIFLRYTIAERLEDPRAAEKAYAQIAWEIPPYPADGLEAMGSQALRRLAEQEQILDVACYAQNKKIRREAMLMLTEQVTLAEFVLRCPDADALEVWPKISLKELQEKIACCAPNDKVREKACVLLGGHRWDGCQCDRCKTIREDGHNWVTKEIIEEETDVGYTEDWVLRSGPSIYTRTYCTKCGRIDGR